MRHIPTCSNSILFRDDEVRYLPHRPLSRMLRHEPRETLHGKIPDEIRILISLSTQSEKSLYDSLRAENFRYGLRGAIIMDIMTIADYMPIYTELHLCIVRGMALLTDE